MIPFEQGGIIAAPFTAGQQFNKENTLRYETPIRLAILWAALLLGGCATVDERDPLEPFNREVHAFNEDLDRKVVRPAAELYQDKVPGPVRTGVSNFFSNLDDVVVLANDILQLKLEQSASDFLRLMTNTLLGIGGLIDVATPLGLPKHHEDLGQTLATWGVGSGPYLVLPFFGPSTFRDSAGMVGDWYLDPGLDRTEGEALAALITLRALDTRAALLRASRVMDQAALDTYSFMRDSYFQHRRSRIYDGNPPPAQFDDFEDFDDDFEFEDWDEDGGEFNEPEAAAPGAAASPRA